MESCHSLDEMLGTLLGTVCNLSFLLLGLNILVCLKANSEKQYKGDRLTIGRMEETVCLKAKVELLSKDGATPLWIASDWLKPNAEDEGPSLWRLCQGQVVCALGRISWKFIKGRSHPTHGVDYLYESFEWRVKGLRNSVFGKNIRSHDSSPCFRKPLESRRRSEKNTVGSVLRPYFHVVPPLSLPFFSLLGS